MWGTVLTVVTVFVIAAAVGLGDYFKHRRMRYLEKAAENELARLEQAASEFHRTGVAPKRKYDTFLELTPPPQDVRRFGNT